MYYALNIEILTKNVNSLFGEQFYCGRYDGCDWRDDVSKTVNSSNCVLLAGPSP